MTTLVDFPVKPEARPYLDAFTERADEPQWLRDVRRQSLDRFARQGFPTRRSENWRYLDLQQLEKKALLPGKPGRDLPLPTELLLEGAALRLVFVDACFSPVLSGLSGLPEGVWLGSMRAALAERRELVSTIAVDSGAEHPFAALNAAFFADGFVFDIAPGVTVDKPIEIVHLVGDAKASLHTRSLVNLGAGSRATIIETYAGTGRYWRNDFAAWRLGEGAALARVALIEEAVDAVHLGEIAATLGAKAKLDGFALLLGGGTVRHEASVTLAGDNAECRIDGAFVVAGREEANIVTTIDHAAVGARPAN